MMPTDDSVDSIGVSPTNTLEQGPSSVTIFDNSINKTMLLTNATFIGEFISMTG